MTDFPRSAVLDGKELVDLSGEIYEGMPVYPGHQRTSVFEVKTHDETRRRFGDDALLTATIGVLLSDHGPTHTDAISHFDPGPDAESVDEMPLHMFFTGAVCVDATHIRTAGDYLDAADLRARLDRDGLSVESGDTVLIHTGHWNRTWGTDRWLTDYGGLTRDATEWLAERGVVNIGADAPSIDSAGEMGRRRRGEDDHYPAHRVCREAGITNTENLCRLDEIAGERFTYIGFPLAIREGTGSPVRAVALRDADA